MTKTIAIDFDGVIHKYSKGWFDGSCYDEPIAGAFEWITRLIDSGLAVFILTTRDIEQVQAWLAKHNFSRPTLLIREMGFFNQTNILGITNLKLPAIYYVDDRALPFTKMTRWETLGKYILSSAHGHNCKCDACCAKI